MNERTTLAVTSLLAILFMTLHHADDVVRGMAPGGFTNLIPIAVLTIWLYATVALAGRRPGYVVVLVASLLASAIPIVHMTGSGLAGGRIANASGAFFFVWTLLALGVTSLFCVILSVRGLVAGRK